MPDVASAVALIQARVTVRSAGGQSWTHVLSEGASLTVGAAEDCEIRLQDDGVAEMHCMVGVTNGKAWIRDCYSPSGTLVNGRRVTETKVTPDDEVKVGPCCLSFSFDDKPSTSDTSFTTPSRSTAQKADPSPRVAERLATPQATGPRNGETAPAGHDPLGRNSVAGQTEADDASGMAQLRDELDQALEQIVELRGQLKRQRGQQVSRSATPAADPFQQEMIDLLRDEVSQLQAELAARDAQLAELEQLTPDETDTPQGAPASEGLLDRLEQLLDELDRKDEHLRSLEDLLRTAEEATKAEHEERAQLEAWVADIEQRFGARESEWEATVTELRRQLDERTSERDRAEGALEEAACDSQADAGDLHERLVRNLREQVAGLERRLAESERQAAGPSPRPAESPEGGSPAYVQAKVDEQLRAERVELARERAALARAQAEFERARQQGPGADDDAAGPASASWATGLDSSQRIRALREHLKDVHDEETKQRQSRGLSGRIASLWRRIEARDD